MSAYFIWRGGTRYFHFNGRERIASQQRHAFDDRDASTPQTINRPYYIGSAQMIGAREQGRDEGRDKRYTLRFSKATLQEAPDEAQRRLAADPKLTEVSVVKIVRVVRRAAPVPPPPPAITIEVVE